MRTAGVTAVALALMWTSALGQWGSIEVSLINPRLATGDVDGDCRLEVIAGGRTGPFRSGDVPPASRSARVVVYRTEDDRLVQIARSENLHVVADIAAADLNRDGRHQVLAVGDGVLSVMEWGQGTLRVRSRVPLNGRRTDRVFVADVDGDGVTEVGVTRYEIDADSEIGWTNIDVYAWIEGRLIFRYQGGVRMHIGDICAVQSAGGKGDDLILEVGAGDEGGEGVVLEFEAGAFLDQWRGPLLPQGTRVMNLARIPGPGREVVVGSPAGDLYFYRSTGSGLLLQRGVFVEPGVTGLDFLPRQADALGPAVIGRRGVPIALHKLPY